MKRKTASDVWGEKMIILEAIARAHGARRPDIKKAFPSLRLDEDGLTQRLQSLKNDSLVYNTGQRWYLTEEGKKRVAPFIGR